MLFGKPAAATATATATTAVLATVGVVLVGCGLWGGSVSQLSAALLAELYCVNAL